MSARAQVDWRNTLVAVLALLLLEGSTLLPVRARTSLALYALAFVAMVIIRRDLLRRGPLRTPFLAAAILSLALPTGAALLPQEARIETFVWLVRPALAGWVAFLIIAPSLFSTNGMPAESRTQPKWIRIALVGVTFALLAIVHQLAVGDMAIISDEAFYLAQARWMSLSSAGWELPPDLARHFLTRKSDYIGGQMIGMYPPGWPALLAMFGAIGLEWWLPVLLGTASVCLMWLIGRRLYGGVGGWIAAGLLATSQVFLAATAGYMAHGALICAFLATTWCFLQGMEAKGVVRLMWWGTAGALLGFTITTRPLTGLVLGASLGLMALWWVVRRAWRDGVVLAAAVAVGAMIPVSLFLLYNLDAFGKPLALGYTVMHPGLYDLGFGVRGFNVRDAAANWTPFTFPFSPLDGVRFLLQRLAALNTTFVPIGLLLPLVAGSVALGARIRWGIVALFSLLPVVLTFYWGSVLRLYMELLPFVLLAVAGLMMVVRTRAPRAAGSFLVLLVASQLIVSLPWPRRAGESHRPWSSGFDHTYGPGAAPGRWATMREAVRLGRENGRVLLFAREESRFDNLIDRLHAFNGDRLEGPVLVARDLGPLNERVMDRFPDRVPYLVIDRGPREIAEFVRLRPPRQ